MLLRIARTRSPGILIFLLIVTLLLWWSSFADMEINRFHFDEPGMPLYQWVVNAIGQNTMLNLVVAFIVLVFQGVILLRFNQKFILISTQTYLHVIFYLLLASSFVQLQQINPGLLSSFFILLMLDQLFSSYRERYILNRVFLAGCFVSLAGLFYIQAVYFIFLIWISLFILRNFDLREWFVPILGFAFPLLFLFAFYYVADPLTVQELITTMQDNFRNEVSITYYNLSYYVFYGLLAVLVIFASFSIIGKFPKFKIFVRKYYEILWWLFAGSVALFVLKSQVSVVFGDIVLFLFILGLTFIQYMN
jgi:hypothetical protein